MALVSTKRMILPVVDETFEDHFTARSWDGPQAQVDDSYPIYIQPTNPTAQFVYKHDVGTLIVDNVLITVSAPIQQIVSSVTAACQLETSADDVTYTPHAPAFQVFTGGFRYVRVTLDFEADDDHELAIVGPVRLRLSLKKKTDEGNGTSSATLPVTMSFTKPFIDVRSITVTAAYNVSFPEGVTGVYDFVDIPNPTTFDVYCFDNATGAQVACAFSWMARGV